MDNQCVAKFSLCKVTLAWMIGLGQYLVNVGSTLLCILHLVTAWSMFGQHAVQVPMWSYYFVLVLLGWYTSGLGYLVSRQYKQYI
jgi:uncharacterized membrane protein AbrB (regulator of aidB expression)